LVVPLLLLLLLLLQHHFQIYARFIGTSIVCPVASLLRSLIGRRCGAVSISRGGRHRGNLGFESGIGNDRAGLARPKMIFPDGAARHYIFKLDRFSPRRGIGFKVIQRAAERQQVSRPLGARLNKKDTGQGKGGGGGSEAADDTFMRADVAVSRRHAARPIHYACLALEFSPLLRCFLILSAAQSVVPNTFRCSLPPPHF
jgi:hypothetical protein